MHQSTYEKFRNSSKKLTENSIFKTRIFKYSIYKREAQTSLISHFLEQISNLEVSLVYLGLLELLKSSRKLEIKEVWASLFIYKLIYSHMTNI